MSEITLERLEKAFIAADDAGESEDAAEFAKAIRGMQALQGSQGLPASTTGGAIAAGGLDGMTFGFGDEAAAGGIAAFESVFGTKGFDETYGAALEMARKLRAQDKEQNPVASYGSEALGGVATAVATGGLGLAAKGTTTAAKAGLGALEGLGYGAAYGFGSGEGGIAQRGKQAAYGAVIGGGVGGVASAAGTKFGQVVANYRANRVAKASGASPDASRVLARAIEAEGPENVVHRIQMGGPDAMLVDGGEALVNQLDAAANASTGGARVAREAIDGRANAANKQMTKALDRSFGQPRGLNQAARDIAGSTREARQQGYDAAYASPIDYGTGAAGDKVLKVLKRVPRRVMNQAIRDANEAMQVEFGARQYKHIMAKAGDDGAITFKEMPNVQQLDYMKRALQEIGQEVDGFRRPTGPATRANMLARDLRDAISDAAPAYGEAVAAGRDKLAQDAALQLGRDMLRSTMRREDIMEGLAKAGPAERSAARQGVREFLDDQVANVRQIASDPNIEAREAAKAIAELSSKAARDKVSLLLGKSEAGMFQLTVKKLQRSLQIKARLARNSATAVRRETMQDVRDLTGPGLVGRAARGEAMQAGKKAISAATGQTDDAIKAREDVLWKEIARLLTSKRGHEAIKLANNLVAAMEKRGATDSEIAEAMVRVRSAGAVGGNLGGEASVSLAGPR